MLLKTLWKNEKMLGTIITMIISVFDMVENIVEKGRKCWLPAFSPFSTMFSNVSKTEIIIVGTLNLSSATVFNLDQSKNMLFGKELKLSFGV